MGQVAGGLRGTLRRVDDGFGESKERLIELARITSVSAPGFPLEEVQRSAVALDELLRQVGLRNVQILDIPGVHPIVYGD